MIRPYDPQDKPLLLRLIQLNIPQYFDPAEADDYSQYLDEEVEDYFVIEENSEVIGAGGINYFLEKGLARISWDMLHPNHQGKGLGKKLVDFRLEVIRENPKITQVEVRTSQLVYPFYQKCGFSLASVEKDFWAEGYDLYQMVLPLY